MEQINGENVIGGIPDQVPVHELEAVQYQQKTQSSESFFDRNITSVVFFGNIVGTVIISSIFSFLLIFGSPRPSVLLAYSPALSPLPTAIIFLLLGFFNFHGKRAEIIKGVVYYFLLILFFLLAGLGLHLLVFGV
jgi:hypothetical protein